MASEQTGVKKKHLKSFCREEHCHQILYRHQDCVPSEKILQNCEQFNSVSLKEIPSKECCGRLDNTKAAFGETQNNKSKLTPRVKKNATNESRLQNVDVRVKDLNCTDVGQEEFLSRSRKRRLRKQKLLESLVSSSNSNIEPVPLIQTNSQIKSVSASHANNQGSAVTSSSSIRSVGEPAKISPKDPRKRPDKSGSRSKSIKTKPLSEQANQTKANIIKTLEEKTLNSLLQTLAPFANSSPKREKPSAIKSPFSFPDNRLPVGVNKVDKDGVFYFGETKHQLEKLTAGLNKSNTSSSLAKEKFDVAQIETANRFFLGSSLGNPPISVPKFNFSLPTNDCVENNTIVETTLANPQIESLDFLNKLKSECMTVGCSVKNENLTLEKDQITTQNFITSKELEPLLVTAVKSLEKPENNIKSIPETFRLFSEDLSSLEPTVPKEDSEITKSISKMKPEEQLKSNKTREEVLKEREAKKAAKLAAKAKHKASKGNEDAGKDSDTSQLDSLTNAKTSCGEIKIDGVLNKKTLGDKSLNKATEVNQNNEIQQVLTENLSDVKIDNFTRSKEPASAKSKAELRAQRRAQQEAQRAVKADSKVTQVKEKPVVEVKPASDTAQSSKKSETPKSLAQPKPKLFSHLYQEKAPLISNVILKNGSLHPAVVRLGVQYSTRVVVGSNSRCVALLSALKQVVNDYITPSEKEFSRGLEEELGLVTTHLNRCRPLAVSMTNALQHIKRSLTQLPNNIPDKEARSKLCDIIDQYIHEQIDVAGKAICDTVKEKILDGDVVLTYGCSSLVYQILVESHLKGTKFRVVVVDGRPWLEGREMLRRLVNKGLSCTYVLITAASFIMREATKVLLGAHALLANGCVMSRAGSSQVALLAHCNNVPVLVCCETHKFSERVQTDAFVYNEIGELCCESVKERDRVTPLSLAYDITPPDLVSAVVTELAVLPCTSVPVILRIKPSESVI